MTYAIEISGLTKRYGAETALAGIDLTVEDGAFCVLVGPSGCGKSTLLRLLSGLEKPDAGQIRLAGTLVADPQAGRFAPPAARQLGLVFQSYALWPHKTARENILWPLKVAGLSKTACAQRLEEVADMLGLTPYLDRYPPALSGGQQQRVAIARSLAPQPGLLLFDEPLSNLDAQLRVEMRGELLKLHRKTGVTIVYVTHDQVEAMTMASQIVVLKAGQVEQAAPVAQILDAPETAFVARFLGNPPANLLPLQRRDGGWHVGDIALRMQGLPDGPENLQVMVKPQHWSVSDLPCDGALPCRLMEGLPFGSEMLIQLDSAIGRLAALVPSGSAPRHGAQLFVTPPLRPCGVFDHLGRRVQ